MIATTNLAPAGIVTEGEIFDWVDRTLGEEAVVTPIWETLTAQEQAISVAFAAKNNILTIWGNRLYNIEIGFAGGFDLYDIGPCGDALRLCLHPGLFPDAESPEAAGALLCSLKEYLREVLYGTGFKIDISDESDASLFSVGWWVKNPAMKDLISCAIAELTDPEEYDL